MPSDLVTHSSDHHPLERFSGRRVAVVGAGQSALETAALLHEAGADVQIIARTPQIAWADPLPAELGLLDYLKRPPTKLCEGWRCAFWNTPAAFQLLPADMRARKARSVLGPMGSWWLRDRVDGKIETLTSHHVRHVAPEGSGVRLTLDGPRQSSIDIDHVIAGTGFRVDLARLTILSEELQAAIATHTHYPIVNRAGESSVPGLYFAGAHTGVRAWDRRCVSSPGRTTSPGSSPPRQLAAPARARATRYPPSLPLPPSDSRNTYRARICHQPRTLARKAREYDRPVD